MNTNKNPRAAFAKALEEAVAEKPYQKVKVGDIAERCSLGRTSFYRYFRDKQDLVEWMYSSEYKATVYKRLRIEEEKGYRYWRNMGECIYYTLLEKPQFYRRIAEYDGQNCFIDFLSVHEANSVEKYLKWTLDMDSLPEELVFDISFYYAGFANAVKRWIARGMRETPEHMQKQCERNLPPYMREYLMRCGR